MSSNTVINTNNSTLSSAFFLSKYYAPNREARKNSNRNGLSNDLLVSYDTNALNRFVKDIRRISYSDVQKNSEINHKNKVSAFVTIYNNFTKSAKKSLSNDMSKRADKLIRLTKNQEAALKKIGITINDDASLSLDTEKLESADIEKVKSLFSNSSDYLKEIKKVTSRLDLGA